MVRTYVCTHKYFLFSGFSYQTPMTSEWHMSLFQRLTLSVLTSSEDDRSLKEMVPLLNVISWLTKYLTPGGTQFTQVHTWVHKVASEKNIGKYHYLFLWIIQVKRFGLNPVELK